ncbi:hypothetical protein [Acinetobacter baumannii]|uniref:hypothetical protein n=1 Tax=Acinetobacter baumannii TaxID=470 RepID=UPI000DA64CB9|nr:hypothetical protein [Acinetobacter baumannii]
MNISFDVYVDSLSKSGELADYALRSGTSVNYILVHLKHRRKIPRKDLIVKLAEESAGAFSAKDLTLWLYQFEAKDNQNQEIKK